MAKNKYVKVLWDGVVASCGHRYARYETLRAHRRPHDARSQVVEVECPACKEVTTVKRNEVRSK